MKEYKIETVQDMFDAVTTENIERFLMDFCITFHTMAESKANCKEAGINLEEIKNPYFIWKDDGKTDISFNFNKTSNDKLEIKQK